jgi:hypothetical protein
VTALDEHGILLDQNMLDDIQGCFDRALRERVQTSGKDGEVGGEVALGPALPFLKAFADCRGRVYGSTQVKVQWQREYRQYLSDLVGNLNALLISARLQLSKRKQWRAGLVVLLDGLDRIEVEALRKEVFVDYADLFTSLAAHTVFTAPVSVVCSEDSSKLAQAFGETKWLPSIRMEKPGGLEKAKEIILRRCAEGLFAEDGLELVCRASGGDIRNIMRLVRTAIEATAWAPVTAKACDDAVWTAARTFANWLVDDDYDALVRVHRDPGLCPTDERGRKLLFNGAILCYANDEGWFRVNPAIERLSRFKRFLEAAGG